MVDRLRACTTHRQPAVCKFLKLTHRQLNRQLVQWVVYLTVYKLFNACMLPRLNMNMILVYQCIAT